MRLRAVVDPAQQQGLCIMDITLLRPVMNLAV